MNAVELSTGHSKKESEFLVTLMMFRILKSIESLGVLLYFTLEQFAYVEICVALIYIFCFLSGRIFSELFT